MATGKTAVRSEWTADELILAIEASQRIARGATRGKVTQELAAELLREHDAVDAAVRSVGNSTQPLLKALTAHLLADARATAASAAAIRALWQAQKAAVAARGPA